MKKALLSMFLAFVAAGFAAADSYSLDAYLARVERSSKDLHNARQDKVLASLAVKQARSPLLPMVAAQADYHRNLLDLEQPTAVGASTIAMGPMYPLVKQDIDTNFDNEISAAIVATQAILNMRAVTALRYGKEYQGLTGTAYQETRSVILTIARKAYYQTVLLQEVVKVKEASEANTLAIYESMKRRLQAGVAQELDVLRAEVNWRTKVSEVTEAWKNLQVAKVALNTLAGADPDGEVVLTDAIDSFPDLPAEAAIDDVLARRSDYQLLLRQQRLAGISIDLAKADFYPVVSASVSFAHQGYRGNDLIDDLSVDVLQLGVTVALPVATGGARSARLESEEVGLDKRKTSLDKKRDEIRGELKRLDLSLREAGQRIEFARKTRHAAETGYRLAKVAEEHGLATQIELNESSLQLEQARLLVLSSVMDYLSVYFDWQRAIGR